MRFNSLSDWLGWLEKNHPKEIDLGLERIRSVAKTLDLLQTSANVITVAGTNGKGSCVAVLEALLPEVHPGSVGVYTSPHFLHYCERIRVDGTPVSEADVCAAFARIDTASRDSGNISLTYFEYGTLAALEVFRQRGVEVMVLEVGLGGRLDAANLIDPDVAVVTSIAIDHEDWLGSDREVIGREKAGIFRRDRIAISADPEPPASIAEYARECGAKLLQAGLDWDFSEGEQSWDWRGQQASGEPTQLQTLPLANLPLPSVAAAIQAIASLDLPVSLDLLQHKLPKVSLPGRYQQLSYQGRQLILDVAHNPAAAAYLAGRLQRQPVTGQTLAVVAMMADKDIEACFTELAGEVDSWVLAGLPDMPRAASAQQLKAAMAGVTLPGADCDNISPETLVCCETVPLALEAALAKAGPDDRILVLGSFFTVAAVLQQVGDLAFSGSE